MPLGERHRRGASSDLRLHRILFSAGAVDFEQLSGSPLVNLGIVAMPPFPDTPADDQAQPIKEELHLHEILDEHGRRILDPVEGQTIRLSAAGGLQRVRYTRDRICDGCGCNAAQGFGHRCQEPGCHRSVCVRCAVDARCRRCLKSLCLQHLNFLLVENQKIGLCPECHAALKRKQLLNKTARFFLRPFVEFTGE